MMIDTDEGRRHRREPPRGEFHDPLSDYRSPSPADPLERSLLGDSVAAIRSTPLISVPPNTTVAKAIALMAEHDAASLVVVDMGGRPMGVFTERDVLNRVAEDFTNLAPQPVSRVMTAAPVCVGPTSTPAQVLNIMSGGPFRHVPVIDVDGKLVGIIGARRIIAYLRHFFDA